MTRFVLLLSYYASLIFAYRYFMLGRWGDDLLEAKWLAAPDTLYPVPISIALAVLVAALASIIGSRAKHSLLVLLAMFPILPMLALYASKGAHTAYMAMCVVAYMLAILSACIPVPKIRMFFENGFINPHLVPAVVVLIAIAFIAGNIYTGGLTTLNFDFDEVYEFRRDAADSRGLLLSYLSTNLVGFLTPIGAALAMRYRQYGALVVLILLNTLIFGLTSQKSHFFAVFATVGLYIIMSFPNPINKLIGTMFLICIFSVIFYWLSPDLHILGTYTVRRSMFVPAYINFIYYEFFSNHSFVYWSDSKIGLGFVARVYDIPTPQVISDYFTNIDFSGRVDRFNNMNTGWLGTGYAHWGVIGMAFYAILAGFMTRIADVLARKTSTAVAASSLYTCFVLAMFNSSDLFTSVLSHGVGMAALVTLLLFPEAQKSYSRRGGVAPISDTGIRVTA